MDKTINVFPPLIGVFLGLDKVPDPVFSEKMVGDGVAIDPLENKIYAPVNGVIKTIAKTKHAITFTDNSGFDLLLHIGLETVGLKGVGFEIYVNEGDSVKAGDIIGEFDLDYVSQCAKSLISPLLLADLDTNKFSFIKLEQEIITKIGLPILQVTNFGNTEDAKKNDHTHLIKSMAIVIQNRDGIHARPSALLATIAKKYTGEILLEKNGIKANVKSVISLMKLTIAFGDSIYIYAPNHEIISEISLAITNLHDNDEEGIQEAATSIDSSKVEGDKYFGIAASAGIATGVLIKRSEVTFEITENSENNVAEKDHLFEALNMVRKDIEYNLAHMTNHAV